jgi:hypothetical protein
LEDLHHPIYVNHQRLPAALPLLLAKEGKVFRKIFRKTETLAYTAKRKGKNSLQKQA